MNREIKFRGKSKDNGKWFYYGDYCTIPEPTIFFYNQDAEIDCIVVDTNTVGQYAGLKDKNGVEIYEGDILLRELENKEGEIFNKDWTEVIFKDGGFRQQWFKKWTSYSSSNKTEIFILDLKIHLQGFRIIGNIYENKDLLK